MQKILGLFAGIALCAGTALAQDVYVDNVVIVLDASGSMKANMRGTEVPRIDAARNAIKAVVKTIPPSTRVGLLVFGGGVNGWVHPLGARNDAEMLKQVDRIGADGGTPLGEYMKTGADTLLQARGEQYGYGSYRLLVVTDGEAKDAALVSTFTQEIVSRGVVIDAIGVDMKKDHTLATKVHSYRRANDPASLQKAIEEVFAEVGKTSGGASGEDAFAEIDWVTEELAMAMITALLSSGNHTIGGQPGDDVSQSPAPSATPVTAVTPQPTPQSVPSRRSGDRSKKFIILAIIFVAFRVFRKLKKR